MLTPTPPDLARPLRVRQRELLRSLSLSPGALPGSLAQSHFRCGHPNCRCARGEPHSKWSLTFMEAGKKRTQHIPKELVEAVRARVQEGKAFQEQVAELLAINARLFALEHQQERARRPSRRGRGEA